MKKIIITDDINHPILTTEKKDMDVSKTIIDAHCHLYMLWQKLDEDYSKLNKALEKAKTAGIEWFVSSALAPEEYQWHRDLHWKNVLLTAGIHPLYKPKEQDFEALVTLTEKKQIIAIGEIGLDKNGGSLKEQTQLLLKQLDLARAYDLPVVFHVVKHYYDLYKILKNNFPKIRGSLHSFNSSSEVVDKFTEFDLAFSISSRMPNQKVLRNIIKRGLILLETDTPFAIPKDIEIPYNEPQYLINNLDKVIDLSGYDSNTIITLQLYTFNEIFTSIETQKTKDNDGKY